MNIHLPTPEESYKNLISRISIPLPKNLFLVSFGKEISEYSTCKTCLGDMIIFYEDNKKGPCPACTNGKAYSLISLNEFIVKKYNNLCLWAHPYSGKSIIGYFDNCKELTEAQIINKKANVTFNQLSNPDNFYVPELSEINALEPNFFGERFFLEENQANFCCEFLNSSLKLKGGFSEELLIKPYAFFL